MIEGSWGTSSLKSVLDIGGFGLAARCNGSRRGTGSGEPKRVGVQRQQTGWLWSGITKLKTQFDSGDLWGRPGQQQIGIADGMESGRAAEGAAEFIAAGGLSNVMDL